MERDQFHALQFTHASSAMANPLTNIFWGVEIGSSAAQEHSWESAGVGWV